MEPRWVRRDRHRGRDGAGQQLGDWPFGTGDVHFVPASGMGLPVLYQFSGLRSPLECRRNIHFTSHFAGDSAEESWQGFTLHHGRDRQPVLGVGDRPSTRSTWPAVHVTRHNFVDPTYGQFTTYARGRASTTALVDSPTGRHVSQIAERFCSVMGIYAGPTSTTSPPRNTQLTT